MCTRLTLWLPDRMPVAIGSFISKHVYNGLLKTRHSLGSPKTCVLIDISHGQEAKSGNSWTVSSPHATYVPQRLTDTPTERQRG